MKTAPRPVRLILASILVSFLCLCSAALAQEGGSWTPGTLPVLYLEIDGGQAETDRMNSSEDHSYKCSGSADLVVPEDYTPFFGGAQDTRRGMTIEAIRGRGNGTWGMAKLPYKLKFKEKQDLFGFGANKHWILLANYFDNSMLRNWLTFTLADQLGLRYTPQGAFVDLVMNGEYLGCYYLCEQIRIGKARVAIDELTADVDDEPGIYGGYLLRMSPDSGLPETGLIETGRGVSFRLQNPSFDPEDGGYVNEVQRNYIGSYVQRAEDAIFARDGSWTEWIDAASLVDYWWLQEFSVNDDAFSTDSSYLFKPRTEPGGGEGKLHWGPFWDMDESWGNALLETILNKGFNNCVPKWVCELRTQEDFLAMLIARWPEVDARLQEITREGGLLDRARDVLRDAWYADRDRWAAARAADGTGIGRDFEQEIEHIRRWIALRREWVSGNLNRLGRIHATITTRGEGIPTETNELYLDVNYDLYDLDIPVREGYTFKAWALEDGTVIEDGFLFLDRDVTLTAVFEKAE